MHLVLGAPNTLTYAVSAGIVALLAFLPGLPLALGLGRRADWDLPMVLVAAFALQIGIVGALAVAAHYLGLSLTALLVAAIVTLLGLGIASLLPLRPWRPDLGTPALVVAAACLALGVFERTWFGRMADAFYHLAAVRSLLVTNAPMVTDPLFRTGISTLDPTSGVWHTVLALWCRMTTLDIANWIWPGATAVCAAIAAIAFWELALVVSRKRWAATLGTVAWLVLGLTADFRWAEYPNRLSLALAFVALAAVARLASRPRWSDAILAVAAGFGTVAMHLAAAETVAAAGGLLLVLLLVRAAVAWMRKEVADWRGPAALAGTGAAVAALAAPLVIPKAAIVSASPLVDFQARQLALGIRHLPFGLLIDTPGHLMKVGPALFLVGAAIAVVAAARAFRHGETHDLVAAALIGLPLVLFADPPLTTLLLQKSYYLTERVAILLPFTLFLGLAWLLAVPTRSQAPRLAAAALSIALVAAGATYFAAGGSASWSPGSHDSIWSSRRDDIRITWGADTLGRLRSEFGTRYPIVAGDTETSYYLAGVMPVAVAGVTSKHTPFAIEETDGPRRRTDMETLMRASTPEAVRRELLTRRHAEYVIVPKYRPDLAPTLAELQRETDLLRPVAETPTIALFRVLP
jgi:hypothetical protein